MINRINFLFIALFMIDTAYSQSGLYLCGQAGIGSTFNNYDQGRKILAPRFQYGTLGKLSVQYRIADRIGLEAGIGQNFSLLKLRDKNFSQRHDGYNSFLKSKISYYSYFGSILYF